MLQGQISAEFNNKLKDFEVELKPWFDHAEKMPQVKATPEEMGLKPLEKVFPDTWTNISLPQQTATQKLLDQSHAQRQLLEQVKSYAMQAHMQNLKHVKKQIELQKGYEETVFTRFDKLHGIMKRIDLHIRGDMKTKNNELHTHFTNEVERLDNELLELNDKFDYLVETSARTLEDKSETMRKELMTIIEANREESQKKLRDIEMRQITKQGFISRKAGPYKTVVEYCEKNDDKVRLISHETD